MDDLTPRKAREVESRARQYAENRTAALLIGLTLLFTFTLALSRGANYTVRAIRAGDWLMAAWGIPLCLAGILTVLWLSAPRRGGRFGEELAERFYGDEGQLLLDPPKQGRIQGRIAVVFFSIFACAFAAAEANVANAQPLSVVLVVPLLLWLGRGLAAGLWAGLYVLHALLLLAGAPIPLKREWSIIAPVVGYGAVAALVAHVRSQHALTKLREAAR